MQDQLKFKYVSNRYAVRVLDTREFPVAKVGVFSTLFFLGVAGLMLLINPAILSNGGTVPVLTGGCMGSCILALLTAFYTFFVWVDGDWDWTPKYKTETVNFPYHRIPLDQKHLWHPVYNQAVTDLYWHAKISNAQSKKIHPEWVGVFADLNLYMEPLTIERERNLNPIPDAKTYLKPIEIEQGLQTGKYSLSEALGDFPD